MNKAKEGYDEVVYLDSINENQIEEIESANLFIYKKCIKNTKIEWIYFGCVTRILL